MENSDDVSVTKNPTEKNGLFQTPTLDKKGATAIEYGLIAALIAIAAVGAMTKMGSQISKTFNNVSTQMSKG